LENEDKTGSKEFVLKSAGKVFMIIGLKYDVLGV